MKILLGSHGFPPHQTAGAEWRTYRTARWLAERGHAVQVLAANDINDTTGNNVTLIKEQVDGISVHRLSHTLNQTAGAQAEFNNPVVYQTLKDILAREQINLFHLISGYRMTGSAVKAAKALQIPVVITLTDFWFLCPRITLRKTTGELCNVPVDPMECTLCLLNQQRRYRLPHQITTGKTSLLLKKIWRQTKLTGAGNVQQLNNMIHARRQFLGQSLAEADKLIAPSNFLATLFKAQGIADRQITVIRQGVNLKQILPESIDRPGKPLTFGYIGQLADHKGVDILVKAFRQLPHGKEEIKLIIYGNLKNAWPPFFKKLMQAIGGDLRVVFAGYFANTEARNVYANLDVLIVPSIWYENSPNVILEAFACGTPVMTSNLGGMAELVKHNVNGFLFEPNDVDSLNNALQHIINQPDQLLHWRKQIPGVKSVNDEMMELEAIYREILSQNIDVASTRPVNGTSG